MADEGRTGRTHSSTDQLRPPIHEGGSLPPDIDFTRPSVARFYDYALGGKNNFPVDRAVADEFFRIMPETRQLAFHNRLVLRRAVRYLTAEAGIRQIIDIGSGLPTQGNVHEIAHAVDPWTHVVYVDNDPVVLAHGRALLADNDTTTVILGDVLQPDSIFDDPTVRNHIDQSQPFAVLLAGILHLLSDAQGPWAVAAAVTERIPPGGYLLATNLLNDGDPRAAALDQMFMTGRLGVGRFRTFEEQLRFFDGLELLEPGLVYANDWRPDDETPKNSPVHRLAAAGLARKP
jgi:hypothetical protein